MLKLTMRQRRCICSTVKDLYREIERTIETKIPGNELCRACGRCCDFESFGHKLFVTTPELIYLRELLGTGGIREMTGPVCPYNRDGRCEIHDHRFLGCRIFFCRLDEEFQNTVMEDALKRIKAICSEEQIPYWYLELPRALDLVRTGNVSSGSPGRGG